MSTLVNIMKQLNGLHAVFQSAERKRQFMEDFIRENQLLADFYTDNISFDLAQRGWFIAGTMYPDQYQSLAKALKARDEDQVEEFLKKHVRGLISDVKENAKKRWQNHAEILADAFDAHIDGKYTLSVPIFLAQADGISADLLGAFLFTNRRGSIRNAASNSIERHLEDRPLVKSFLGLLLETSGLRTDTDERDEFAATGHIFSPLNRHGVLHGLDLDYATEANSLRGIALISFLDWIAQTIPTNEGSPT